MWYSREMGCTADKTQAEIQIFNAAPRALIEMLWTENSSGQLPLLLLPCTLSSHLPLKVNPPIQQQVQIWVLARSSLTEQSWFYTLFFFFGHYVGQAPVINYFYVPNSSSMKQSNPLRILLCCVFLWCMTSVECHKLITFLITALYWIRDVLSIE